MDADIEILTEPEPAMEDLVALNNCELFNQLRTAITDYHDNIKKLSTFLYFSGNEDNINKLSKIVNKVLLEHHLIHQDPFNATIQANPYADKDKLRGAFIYLLVNSMKVEPEDKERTTWNPQCLHLLNQLPVPYAHFIVVSLAMSCGMDQQLFEFMACGPYSFSSEYMDVFSDTLSHLIPDKLAALPFISRCIRATLESLAYKSDSCASSGNLTSNALRLLQRHLQDTPERLLSLGSKSKRTKYLGKALYMLLDNVLEVVKAITAPPPQPDYYNFYQVRKSEDRYLREKALDLKVQLRMFAENLMDVVQRLLPHVSVDVYMGWHDLPSTKLMFGLQAAIGNLSQELITILGTNESLKNHSLFSQLRNFADGAQSFEQRLETAPLGELLKFLDRDLGDPSDEELLAGINQLIKLPIAFVCEECVCSLSSNVELMGVPHAEKILEHLHQVMQANLIGDYDGDLEAQPYEDLLIYVLLPIFESLTRLDEKVYLLQKRDQLNLMSTYCFQRADFASECTSFINELPCSDENVPVMKFLDLCFQQPDQTWLALARLATTSVGYASLYWRMAEGCDLYAAANASGPVTQLVLDEKLFTAETNDFVASLHYLPIYLIKPDRLTDDNFIYNVEEAQTWMETYFTAFAMGLQKYTESLNYVALEKLLKILMYIEPSEFRMFYRNRMAIQSYLLKNMESKVKLAESFYAIIGKLDTWRATNWKLNSQIIISIDQLRCDDFNCFDEDKANILDRFMHYHMRFTPQALRCSNETKPNIMALVPTLKHQHMWQNEQLELLMEEIPREPRDINRSIQLLRQASTVEAVKLFSDAIRHKTDLAVMALLSETVDSFTDSPNAQLAYGFIFKSYMKAFHEARIIVSKAQDYPQLIEHLLKLPKLQDEQNIRSAVSNFKILFKILEANEAFVTKLTRYIRDSQGDPRATQLI